MLRPAPLVFAGCAVLLLTACADTRQASMPPVSEMSRVELTGLMIQSPDGRRSLGYVEDLHASPAGGPPMILVSTGAPLYPVEVNRRVEAAAFRFAPDRQALILDVATFEAAQPLTAPVAGHAVPVPPYDSTATNWTGATRHR